MEEFNLIEYIKNNLSLKKKEVIKGIGDDCAVIKKNKNFCFIITSDSLVEDIHFKKEYFSPYDIGEKSVAVNISDISAMGGSPLYLILNVGFNKNEKESYIKKIYNTIIKYSENYGIEIIGGDTVRSEKLFISITLIGEVEKNFLLTRSGAKEGDIVFTTGSLGDSYAGYKVLSNKKLQRLKYKLNPLIKKHLNPIPKYVEGRLLGESRFVSSCIDISDGLISDLKRISENSNVGVEIFIDKLPVSESVLFVTKKLKENYIDYILYGGEDYELLFTVKKNKKKLFLEFIKKYNIKVYEIGKIIKEKKIYLIDKNNKKREVDFNKIWKHF